MFIRKRCRMSSATVSVIIGTFNPKEEQLLKAVRSVIDQTFSDWEMILYDDGSDPDAAETIRHAAKLDRRIRHVRNGVNRGLAYALDQCIKRSEGSYIARMDDDDISRPDRLERQVRFLQEHPDYQWVGSNADLFDETGVWKTERMPEIPEEKDFLRYSPYIHPSVMFRRETVWGRNAYISSGVTKRCEDYELFMRLHMQGRKGYNMQESLLLYREDRDSYTRRSIDNRLNEMRIRYRGFKRMGILRPSTAVYVFRPLAGAVLPNGLLHYILRRNKNGSSDRCEKGQI